jgi:hypothetical protein
VTNITLPILGPLAWIDVILLGWFALTAGSVVYVAWDAFTNNPEMTVMKWGWVLVTLYLGPISLFLYIMSCKEPAPGTHEEFIKPLWKQGLGSALIPKIDRAYQPTIWSTPSSFRNGWSDRATPTQR